MNTMAWTALVSAWLLGTTIVAALWPRHRPAQSDLALIAPLGALVGLGATSTTFFFASLLSSQPALVAGAADFVLTVALIRIVRRRSPEGTPIILTPWSWLDWALATALLQTAVAATVLACRAYSAEPYGGWDGWAIWNMHARFMLRAGTAWPELLSAPQLNWTHPDYPRLVSASVARVWAWSGGEFPAASAWVSGLFAAALATLLVAVIARHRGRTAALLAGLLLLSTPFFVTFSTNQHADIPLASLMLAAVALALLGEHWVLAGLCAGFAAWTKNEGLLFAAVFALVCGLSLWRQGSRSALLRLGAGLAVGLLPALYFKLLLAPPNDLAAAPLVPRLTQLVDGARHRAILSALARDGAHFGEWSVAPWIALALPFLAWPLRRRLAHGEIIVSGVLVLMLAGYYVVYLMSPHDLAWHLDTSLVRLLLQLWPLALLAWCLSVPLPAFAPAAASHQRATRGVFVVANILGALVLLGALSRQLATDELAVTHTPRATVVAALGEGWFGAERHGRETWAWSGAAATLRLHASAPDPVTLRFQLRSLGPRTVTVRHGVHVLWQGAVNRDFVPVEIAGLALTSGANALEFTTDAPGVPEPVGADPRALAFAIYNVTLR